MKLPEKGGEAMLFKRIRRTKLKFPPIANKQFEKIFKEIAELEDQKRRLELESKRLLNDLDDFTKSREIKMLQDILKRMFR